MVYLHCSELGYFVITHPYLLVFRKSKINKEQRKNVEIYEYALVIEWIIITVILRVIYLDIRNTSNTVFTCFCNNKIFYFTFHLRNIFECDIVARDCYVRQLPFLFHWVKYRFLPLLRRLNPAEPVVEQSVIL